MSLSNMILFFSSLITKDARGGLEKSTFYNLENESGLCFVHGV